MQKFFEKYKISSDDKIVVACSGGADSMYLLSEIIKFHPKKSILVGHFNHNLRWDESDADSLFVEDFCRGQDLRFLLWSAEIKRFAKENKLWIEEAARIKRYGFLEDTRADNWAGFIFTAHHLDDSIETFMFNLIRWTKIGWLTWIDERNWFILRPLLHITKKEILKKCEAEGIPYRNDSSNVDDTFLRNHIRLNILPQFETINPNYKKNFDDLIEYFKELESNIEGDISKIIMDNSFEIKAFDNLSLFKQKELIAYIFKITNSWTIGLTKWNIDEVIRFINDKWNHTKKDIKAMHLFKKNGKIFLINP
ncbi:MAG: hypothetical protein ACD_2C00233G0002 [uncultured bacterium (gcode 4)]|uniref:tRNA(Ile)-lysidine synthase n=1 Tax=uncultured bacterium (gcode 4) TaxID=1234023 RepID=K2GFK1_9BACT|nr:MAG: hypothetical protein ACD_2C00233G0002 [uncultured bacterium (gcode 4)]